MNRRLFLSTLVAAIPGSWVLRTPKPQKPHIEDVLEELYQGAAVGDMVFFRGPDDLSPPGQWLRLGDDWAQYLGDGVWVGPEAQRMIEKLSWVRSGLVVAARQKAHIGEQPDSRNTCEVHESPSAPTTLGCEATCLIDEWPDQLPLGDLQGSTPEEWEQLEPAQTLG